MLCQWLIVDYLEMSRVEIINQFVMNITHDYRIYYTGSNIRMSPWLCYCLPCIHGQNIYNPGLYLLLFHLTDVITSSILFEKAGIYIYTWWSNPWGWCQRVPGEYWHSRLHGFFFSQQKEHLSGSWPKGIELPPWLTAIYQSTVK